MLMPDYLILANGNLDYSSAMIDAASAIATTLAATQLQASLIAIRLANESQRQVVNLLAASVHESANPEDLPTNREPGHRDHIPRRRWILRRIQLCQYRHPR